MKEMEQIFRLLGEWRKLPKYQLERRLDIFFALYLPQILKEKIGEFSYDDIIPELPLKKHNPKNNSSNNADYAVFHEENNKVKLYLIELKTDINSIFDENQVEYYKNNTNFEIILEGITEIQKNTKGIYKTKYNALLEKLQKYGIVRKSQDEKTWERTENEVHAEVEIIYIVPERNAKIDEVLGKFDIITFEKIIEILGDNVISTEFKKLLRNIIGE